MAFRKQKPAATANPNETNKQVEVVATSGISLPWLIAAGATVVLLAFVISPIVLESNPVAQTFFNLCVAGITTVISVYATKFYSQSQERDELTRYGLQAWRNLDSLAVKLSQQMGKSGMDMKTLESWLLDIDQAKWAWRDLLREVFELQMRLQAETDELSSEYKERISAASTPDAKSRLQSIQAAKLAKLVSSAPLPLKLSEDVACPNCDSITGVRLGAAPGEIAWAACPNCLIRFPVSRQSDGCVKIGKHDDATSITVHCPKCKKDIVLTVPIDHSKQFVTVCTECQTHVQFNGNAKNHQVNDLGVSNTSVTCPSCQTANDYWIAPGREVSFVKRCSRCDKWLRITGSMEDFFVTEETAYENSKS